MASACIEYGRITAFNEFPLISVGNIFRRAVPLLLKVSAAVLARERSVPGFASIAEGGIEKRVVDKLAGKVFQSLKTTTRRVKARDEGPQGICESEAPDAPSAGAVAGSNAVVALPQASLETQGKAALPINQAVRWPSSKTRVQTAFQRLAIREGKMNPEAKPAN